MRFWKLWLGLVVVIALAIGGTWLWWDNTQRFRPANITVSQLEILSQLEHAGWVSPTSPRGAATTPRTLYMISFRDCPDCQRFEREMFPRLRTAGVDIRVIMVARADAEGVARSTPSERATVAELWTNRSWPLWERWHGTTPELWTADNIPPADNDTTRTAVIQAGRQMVTELTPLMRSNHINFAYPLLVWKTPEGGLHGCACESPRTYRYLTRELGL